MPDVQIPEMEAEVGLGEVHLDDVLPDTGDGELLTLPGPSPVEEWRAGPAHWAIIAGIVVGGWWLCSRRSSSGGGSSSSSSGRSGGNAAARKPQDAEELRRKRLEALERISGGGGTTSGPAAEEEGLRRRAGGTGEDGAASGTTATPSGEQADVQKASVQKAAAEKAAAEQRAAVEKAASAQKTATDKAAAKQRAATEKAAAAQKAATEKTAAEQRAATEKAASVQKAATEKAATEQRAAAEKAASMQKAAAEKAAAEQRAGAEKAAADKAAAEKKAAQKAEAPFEDNAPPFSVRAQGAVDGSVAVHMVEGITGGLTVVELEERIAAAFGTGDDVRLRLLYMGRELKEAEARLAAAGLKEGATIQVMFSSGPPRRRPPGLGPSTAAAQISADTSGASADTPPGAAVQTAGMAAMPELEVQLAEAYRAMQPTPATPAEAWQAMAQLEVQLARATDPDEELHAQQASAILRQMLSMLTHDSNTAMVSTATMMVPDIAKIWSFEPTRDHLVRMLNPPGWVEADGSGDASGSSSSAAGALPS